jgi:hypothetical protein
VAFTISGNCRGQDGAIQTAVSSACGNLGTTITDAELRSCIQQRCESAEIQCEDCKDRNLLGYNNWWWFLGWHKSSTIHFCVNNIRNANLGDVAVHEWAHSCCWNHGDGKGVPGNDGSLPN